MNRLHSKLHHHFTYKWVSAIKGIEQESIDLWSVELAGLTGNDIILGIDRAKHCEWPPSAVEFRKLCLPEIDAHKQNSGAYKRYKPLPKPVPNRTKAMTAINEMKGKLK